MPPVTVDKPVPPLAAADRQRQFATARPLKVEAAARKDPVALAIVASLLPSATPRNGLRQRAVVRRVTVADAAVRSIAARSVAAGKEPDDHRNRG